MKIRKLLINLKNPVDAFSIKPEQLQSIRRALPETDIMVTEDNAVFREKLAEVDCVLAWVFKPGWYAEAPQLQAVYTPAAGHDWVAADPAGRVKTYYGRYHGKIMRESLLSMMLYFNRNIPKSLKDQGKRFWGRFGYNDCTCLFSQQVLIVGFGSLGQSMAELLKAFGATVVAVKRNTAGFENHPHADRVVTFDRLEQELPQADHVVLVLPGGKDTEGIITANHFKSLKPGAYLYNLGRGSCYREEDLIAALQGDRLAGAGLDVFAQEPLPESSPLWDLPNVLLTPHSSAISREYLDLFIDEWLASLKAV